MSNLYFDESYPPTDAGRRLIAAFDEVQVQLLASIQANDRGCVDGIYWHELEHVAFAQQIEGILGDCDINRKSLYENIRDMNESRALFASIVRVKGSTSRAFLLFYNQNQLDGLRPIGDCPEMKKTVDAILDGAACTEQHMISYLIAMYGNEICNEDTRILQLIDKEKLMKLVPVSTSLGDMSSVILFDYTQRLLHDIANDPQLVVDRIVQIQKEILPIWANKLSFALQKTTLYSSTDSTPPQQST